MKNSYRFRIHEWAADHFGFVQYPNVHRMYPQPQQRLKRPVLWAGRIAASALLAPVAVVVLFVLYAMCRVFAAMFLS